LSVLLGVVRFERPKSSTSVDFQALELRHFENGQIMSEAGRVQRATPFLPIFGRWIEIDTPIFRLDSLGGFNDPQSRSGSLHSEFPAWIDTDEASHASAWLVGRAVDQSGPLGSGIVKSMPGSGN
jgi:hypothetical protein